MTSDHTKSMLDKLLYITSPIRVYLLLFRVYIYCRREDGRAMITAYQLSESTFPGWANRFTISPPALSYRHRQSSHNPDKPPRLSYAASPGQVLIPALPHPQELQVHPTNGYWYVDAANWVCRARNAQMRRVLPDDPRPAERWCPAYWTGSSTGRLPHVVAPVAHDVCSVH